MTATAHDQRDRAPASGDTPSNRLPQEAPAADLRVVVFTVAGGELLIALQSGESGPRLPNDLPLPGQSLDAAARRIVQATIEQPEQYLEQLYTFSAIEAGDGRLIVVSYIALVCSGSAPAASPATEWQPVRSLTAIGDIDRLVVDYALVRLRAKMGYTNIAFHLLPEAFTLTELQSAYETILGRRLDKRNFRRRMIASGILLETKQKRRDGSHRPAALYRFRAEHDPGTYLTPPWAGPDEGASDV